MKEISQSIASEQGPEVSIARELWSLEKHRKDLEDQAEALKVAYREKAQELQQILIDEGKASTGHILGVGEFCIKRESYMSITKDKMPGFIAFMKETNHGAIVKESIEPGTLKTHLALTLEELAVAIDTCGVEEALQDYFAHRLVELWPRMRVSASWLRHQAGEPVAAEELAADALKLLGVAVFQEVKLSHTKKGK